MSKKETLNIYEVLETLNNKINSNTTQLKNNTEQLKFQLDEVKVYLLENIEKKAKASLDLLNLKKKHMKIVKILVVNRKD
jgi:hypothetical protein